jgi:hypothetical protein
MTSREDTDQKNETASSSTSAGVPSLSPSTALPGDKPNPTGLVAAIAPPTPPRIEAKSPNPAAKAPVATPKPESSLPVSMVVRPAGAEAPSSDTQSPQFPGELAESFATALARVAPPLSRAGLFGGWWRRSTREASRTQRVVAFDGFRSDLYDDKLERDRRYGTVYTVVEQRNAYLVRLEMPRRLASSALRATWNMPREMPDYNYTIALTNNVLIVKASVPGDALRRLSYVSTSFPADFMTRIEFARLVDGFVHRLRDKVLEIIVFTRAAAHDTNRTVAVQSSAQ